MAIKGTAAWSGLFAALVLAALVGAPARAQELTAWDQANAARFAAFQTLHPRAEADVARLKARSRRLVAAAGPLAVAKGEDDPVLDRPPLIWRASKAPVVLWDRPDAPPMVVVPAGEFTMGSPPGEPGRKPNEGPRRRVRLSQPFAVSQYPVTMGQFAHFVAASGYRIADQCRTPEEGAWKDRDGRSWRNPSFAQTPDDPVTCMNFQDGMAYAAWLSKATGHPYRLLSEAQYEYANRGGTASAYWWGPAIDQGFVNCNGCGDRPARPQTIPVGGYPANPFGLYDTTGNVWSWTTDCATETYAGAPTNGDPDLTGDCTRRMSRGGAWYYVPGSLRSAIRTGYPAENRNYHNGFRVARAL